MRLPTRVLSLTKIRQGLVLGGCLWAAFTPAEAQALTKVACFGDPSTHSDQLQRSQEYPAKLQALLGSAFEVKNFGDCCGTVLRAGRYNNTHNSHAFVAPGFELEQSIAYLPDIVVIGGVGKHDIDETGGLGPQNSIVAAEFEEDYEILVKKYLDMPSHPKVLVATPVPYPQGENKPAEFKPITTIVLPAVKKTAAKYNLPIIDLYGTFFNKDPAFFKDDFHLSDVKGLQKEADVVFAAVQSLLANPNPAGGGSGGMAGAGGSGAGSGGSSGGGNGGVPATGAGGTIGGAPTAGGAGSSGGQALSTSAGSASLMNNSGAGGGTQGVPGPSGTAGGSAAPTSNGADASCALRASPGGRSADGLGLSVLALMMLVLRGGRARPT